jgi:hypothetical protein
MNLPSKADPFKKLNSLRSQRTVLSLLIKLELMTNSFDPQSKASIVDQRGCHIAIAVMELVIAKSPETFEPQLR